VGGDHRCARHRHAGTGAFAASYWPHAENILISWQEQVFKLILDGSDSGANR
jgi:hypothetical protein